MAKSKVKRQTKQQSPSTAGPIWDEKFSELRYGKAKPTLDMFTQGEACEMAFDDFICAPRVVALVKLLIEALGKEEAGKRIAKPVYEEYYKYGREAAKKSGYPKDLDSLCEEFLIKAPPWVNLVEFTYRTPEKVIIRSKRYCFPAETIKKHANKEMQEFIAKYLCGQQDKGWVEGFNPKVKYTHSKHWLRGDNCCEYIIEL